MSENISWSDWLDFNSETISKVPGSPGAYMMHASMKILFIEGSKDIRKGLEKTLSSPCITQATRFRYTVAKEYQRIQDDLIRDYKNRHDGNLPKCMQETYS